MGRTLPDGQRRGLTLSGVAEAYLESDTLLISQRVLRAADKELEDGETPMAVVPAFTLAHPFRGLMIVTDRRLLFVKWGRLRVLPYPHVRRYRFTKMTKLELVDDHGAELRIFSDQKPPVKYLVAKRDAGTLPSISAKLREFLGERFTSDYIAG
jgi:hypothetical protein